jgi:hypothetical protein
VNLLAISLNNAKICDIKDFSSPIQFSNKSSKLIYKVNVILIIGNHYQLPSYFSLLKIMVPT